jgi:heme exporter protein CcmD
MDHLLNFQGHAAFVWGAYVPTLILLLAEAWAVRARLQRARDAAARGDDDDQEASR